MFDKKEGWVWAAENFLEVANLMTALLKRITSLEQKAEYADEDVEDLWERVEALEDWQAKHDDFLEDVDDGQLDNDHLDEADMYDGVLEQFSPEWWEAVWDDTADPIDENEDDEDADGFTSTAEWPSEDPEWKKKHARGDYV